MENKEQWYRKLLRKLNNIKAGKLELDEYINEVKGKIEEYSNLSTSVCNCKCLSEYDRMNCINDCQNKPKIVYQ